MLCIEAATSLHSSNAWGLAVPITTFSSRELNQGVTRAKRAAQNGPVIITDRGKPAYVLLSFEDYLRLTRQRRNIAQALAMPGVDVLDFDPPRTLPVLRPVNFS